MSNVRRVKGADDYKWVFGAADTGKPCEPTQRSHINFCVYDSTWESTHSFELDRNVNVSAWVKNDHLGFEILYIFEGVVRKYRPDFLVRLKNNEMLILETKGQKSAEVEAKRKAAEEWIKAVNAQGGFGVWHYAIAYDPRELSDILADEKKKAA